MYYTPLLFVFFCLLQENAKKENHESFFPPTKQDDFFVRQQNEETGTSRNLWTLTFEISSSRVLLPVMAIAVKSFQPERNLFPVFPVWESSADPDAMDARGTLQRLIANRNQT